MQSPAGVLRFLGREYRLGAVCLQEFPRGRVAGTIGAATIDQIRDTPGLVLDIPGYLS